MMSTPSLDRLGVLSDFDQIVETWVARKEGKYSLQSVRITEYLLQSIAQEKPVTAEEFAAQRGLSLKEARIRFRKMRMSGADFDDEGRLIGNALTMLPTRNELTVNGRKLHAWCALDTLFLPGLIGETAMVRSKSPQSGKPVQLTVSPHGVEAFEPAEAVLSVVVPGVSRAYEPGRPGGSQGDVCSSMHFFAARGEAVDYLGEDPDIAILTVEQASELAQRAWVRPYRSALESSDQLGANR